MEPASRKEHGNGQPPMGACVMTYYPTLDSDKGHMAQLLAELDRNSHFLNETQRAIVNRALEQYKRERAAVLAYQSRQDYQHQRNSWISERADQVMAEYPKAEDNGDTQCTMRVTNSRGFGTHRCRNNAARWVDGNLCGPHAKAQAVQTAKDDRWRFEREQREAQ